MENTNKKESKYFGLKGTKTCGEYTGYGLANAGYWAGKVLGSTVGILVDGVVNASQGVYNVCRPATPAELRAKAAKREEKARAKTQVEVSATPIDEDHELPTVKERAV